MGHIAAELENRETFIKPNSLRILAIEDNPADIRILKEYLSEDPRIDFEIVHAGTLKQALEIIPVVRFSVIILDLNLPDSMGMEGLEKLNALNPLPPVIVLTGLDSEETGLIALSKNAQDFLVKRKINGDMLIRSIRYAIERDKAEESLRHMNAELEKRTEELQAANERLNASREAALNLMEDAVNARRQAEQSAADLARALEDLRRSEEIFRQIAENSQDIYWLMNADLKGLHYLSPAYETICKMPASEQKRSYFWLDCVRPEDYDSLLDALRMRSAGGLNEEFRITRPDGSFRWIWARTFPILDKTGKLQRVLGVARDITDRKFFEEKIIVIHKLESIGLLAGGIAHDFNNLLTAIIGNISLAKYVLPSDSAANEYLDSSEKACELAKELSYRLLTFSKGGEPVKNVMRINDLLRETVSFMLSGSNVRPRFNLDEGLAHVDIDPNQIRQVVQNLVINAKEAMPGGGEITINAGAVTVIGEEALDLFPGAYVKISVADQGKGIQPEDLQRIFDPYFSTSDMGSQKGRGLGLAICLSIVKKHSGDITVESSVGKGTTFHIYLPAATLPS